MSFNPYQVRSGDFLKIKLAYLGCLIEAYADTELLDELQKNRHEMPIQRHGKDVMNDYKTMCRSCNNGDIAVAFDRMKR